MILIVILAMVNMIAAAGRYAVAESAAKFSKEKERGERSEAAFGLIHTMLTVYMGAFSAFAVGGRMLYRDDSLAYIDQPIFVVISIIASFLLLTLCHTLPKSIARRFPAALGRVFLPMGTMLAVPLKPLLAAHDFCVRAFAALFPPQNTAGVTEEEIRMMVMAGGEKGSIEETEKEMINNVFDFNNTIVEEICTHRKDIFALSLDAPLSEVMTAAAEERYTRIPVYDDNIDNIVGVLHIKDIFKVIQNGNSKSFNLTGLVHKPYFVPLSKTTSRLFAEMQKEKVHIAIVVDEYGGTAGLVTMEDLVEEIMGSIQDEYDDEERPEINLIAQNAYEVDGGAELDAVAEFFESPLPIDDYDTLGGFLIGLLGRVPADGEQPQILYENLLFKIMLINDRRISAVVVCKLS